MTRTDGPEDEYAGRNEVTLDDVPGSRVQVDPKLLDVLVCPVTKGTLTYDRAAGELISLAAGLAYPVRDGIPIMLPEEARRLEGL
jgi:uncharacterized protein YbaR (Trm112 family)